MGNTNYKSLTSCSKVSSTNCLQDFLRVKDNSDIQQQGAAKQDHFSLHLYFLKLHYMKFSNFI